MAEGEEALRRLLEETQYRLREAEGRAQEAERQAQEVTENLALDPYLKECHSLNMAIEVVNDPSTSTKGETTNPAGRNCPRRIMPWVGFRAEQEAIWARLKSEEPSSGFSTKRQFPNKAQLQFVRGAIQPISSEMALRNVENITTENAVKQLIDAVCENPVLRERFALSGGVTFDCHTNLGQTDASVSGSASSKQSGEHMVLDGNGAEDATDPTTPTPGKTKTHHIGGRGRGKSGQADQFCIYQTPAGQKIPRVAIEYKAPHKLSQESILEGLVGEIQPFRDIINQDGGDDDSTPASSSNLQSKILATAVITQLFSYMVNRGYQYGYVSTGQAFIFLHITDDPNTVFYHVCVPSLHVVNGDKNRLQKTAAAEVFAFVLQSLSAPSSPPPSWHDRG